MYCLQPTRRNLSRLDEEALDYDLLEELVGWAVEQQQAEAERQAGTRGGHRGKPAAGAILVFLPGGWAGPRGGSRLFPGSPAWHACIE